MGRFGRWIAGAAVVLLVLGAAALAVVNWTGIGGTGIDTNGWIALTLGVVVTLALGVGLMALVFISSRQGYDEPPRGDR